MKRILFFLYLPTILLAFCNKGDGEHFDQHIIENIAEDIQQLKSDNSFVFSHLGLTEQEIDVINNLEVKLQVSYDRFGDLHLLKDELSNFLCKIGNNDPELTSEVVKIIEKVVLRVVEASQKETAWVCVRASCPNNLFDTPRWHTDGFFFMPPPDFQYKFAITLKGNQTLFYDLPEELKKAYLPTINDREYMSKMLDVNNSVSAEIGYGAFFVVGDPNRAAIHSEPKIDSERLFISILPGNTDEISELYNRWHPLH